MRQVINNIFLSFENDDSYFISFFPRINASLKKLAEARPRVLDSLQALIDENQDRKICLTMNGFSNSDYQKMATMSVGPTQREILMQEHLSLFCPKSKAWLLKKSELSILMRNALFPLTSLAFFLDMHSLDSPFCEVRKMHQVAAPTSQNGESSECMNIQKPKSRVVEQNFKNLGDIFR